MTHPDQIYIEAIRQNNTATIRRMIGEAYPAVEKWICRNGGDSTEAQDVFGDALEAICRKLREGGDIRLTARISTYLFSICKFLWYKRLRKKNRGSEVSESLSEVLSAEAENLHDALQETEKMSFFRKKVAELGQICRELLEMVFADEAITMAEIAEKLELGNANNASKRKFDCIERLKKNITSDPYWEAY